MQLTVKTMVWMRHPDRESLHKTCLGLAVNAREIPSEPISTTLFAELQREVDREIQGRR